MEKKTVYAGIRATGRLHLGNYFGSVKGMLALQDKYNCIFSVVDLHTITVPYDVKLLKQSVKEIIIDYLAVGLDPKKCHIEIQSGIPGHTQLAYLLSTIYPVSRLEDLPTYKDKKAQYPKYVNMGLLYYPVLMAADILLYKAELVPVGIDQEPHLEVAREIARKFNSMFGITFPQPVRFKTPGDYIPSLSGKGKMSKSVEGSYITLIDDLETINKRLSQVPTDSGKKGGDLPKEGGIANLFILIKLFKRDDLFNKFEHDYKNGTIKYVDLKSNLAQLIYDNLKPIQTKRREILENTKMLDRLIKDSLENCAQIADKTMSEVVDKMGLKYTDF